MNKFKLPLNIYIRLIGSFLNIFTTSSIIPFIALYLSDNTSKVFTSIYLALTVIATFLFNILAGYFVDRLPRKNILVVSSYASTLFAVILTIFVWKEWIFLFIITHFLQLIANAFISPSSRAIIQDAVNDSNRDLTYRIDYWLVNLGFSLGVLYGGALYLHYKVELFLTSAILSLLLSILYQIFIKDTREYIIEKTSSKFFIDIIKSYYTVWQDKRYIKLMLGITIILTAEALTNNYVAIRLNDYFETIHLFSFKIDGVRMLTIINFVNAVAVVILTLPIGSLVKNLNKREVLIFGLFLYAIGYSVNMFANIWWVLVIAIFIASIGEILYAPITNSESIKLIPKDKRGSYNAVTSIQTSGAQLIARLSIILGTFLSPVFMGVSLFLFLTIGIVLSVNSLFKNTYSNR